MSVLAAGSRLLLTVTVVLLAAGCTATTSRGTSAAGTVDGAARATPAAGTVTDRALPTGVLQLPLTDAAGRATTLKSLDGKALVVTDFLTTCQEVCPMTSVNMRDVADAVDRAGLGGTVQLLEITVDPGRDDPARLAAYQKLFGAARPDWRLLTGTPTAIATLWRAFGVAYSQVPEDGTPPPTDWLTGKPLTYDVTHQDVVFLLDGTGRERWLVEGTPDVAGELPPATLDSFLNDDGRGNLTAPSGPTWTARDVESAVSWLTGRRIP